MMHPQDLAFAAPGWPAAICTRYEGPERRFATSLAWQWLVAMVDEVDYGLVMLSEQGLVLHSNRTARQELDASHPLRLRSSRLTACDGNDALALNAAIKDAAERNLRRLLTLGPAEQRVSLSIVPLARLGSDERAAVLVILGKRQLCAELAVQAFARSHGLTASETRVLAALYEGMSPGRIAERHGVALCTVRTQIGSIRLKTGAASIRDLLRQVATLPPLLGVLRPGGLSSASSNQDFLLRA